MTRQPSIARHAEELLGTAVVATAPLAGGDTSAATKLRLSDGTTAIMKTHAHPPDGFFTTEAAGLRWLGEASADGGVAVPDVLAVDEGCLIIRWVEPGKASADAAVELRPGARRDARRRRAVVRRRGGRLHLQAAAARTRRATRGRSSTPCAGCCPTSSWPATAAPSPTPRPALVEGVIGKLTALLPEEPPARLHGDLWNGNVLWGQESRVWLIDPAAYGGHRELDLAMLALFGLPHLPRVLEAYAERAPLADGWEERISLHHLFPLLVHAALFGGGYGARAAEAAARYA